MTADDPSRMRFIDSIWMDLDTADAPIAVGAVLEFAGRAPSGRGCASAWPRSPTTRCDCGRCRWPAAAVCCSPRGEEVDPDLEVHVVRESTPDLAMAVSGDHVAPDADGPAAVGLDNRHRLRAPGVGGDLAHPSPIADGEGVTMLIGRTLDMEPEGGTTLTDWMVSQVLAMKAAARAEDADEADGGDSPMDKIFGAVKAAGTAPRSR